ncbi:DUF6221 family protein [Actinoplanes sp. NPDC023936]|uniref:DUF6221 family protein n=1 Tax=Actinoplanes sp. NPDC023936 TaxID=3154910 RepID=UPI0033F985A5
MTVLCAADLYAFLLARFDEDERVALALKNDGFGIYPDGHADAGVAFLGRFDEDRMLGEVEAKRRILVRLWNPDEVIWREDIASGTALPVFKALALPYDRHPDYREEWQL